jgi:hypothetical protein
LSPGREQAHYRFNALTQTSVNLPAMAASALQLTEYLDATCTTAVATEIMTSFPFIGCSNGVQVKTLPKSPYIINPCFYFRQNGLLSSSTVKPAMPLLPGIWNVTSTYTTAAGCTDTTKQAIPLYCSAKPAGTAPGQTCKAKACSVRVVCYDPLSHVVFSSPFPTAQLVCFQVIPDAQVDPFGLQVGGTCLMVVTPPPTREPTAVSPTKSPTKSPTRAPTKKGKVAAAAEAVGAALGMGLRGAAAV